IESKIESVWKRFEDCKDDYKKLEVQDFAKTYTDIEKVVTLRNKLELELEQIETKVLDEYYPRGSIMNLETQDDYFLADITLKSTSFDRVYECVRDLEWEIQNGERLARGINYFHEQSINLSKIYLPQKLLEEAQTVYENGLKAIESKTTQAIFNSRNELIRIGNQAKSIEKVSGELVIAYNLTMRVAKEPLALEKANSIYSRAKQSLEDLNPDSAKVLIEKLQDLERGLNQRYRLQLN
ncbi:MAG: hypothetical protein KKH40_07325, partial [Nanoarchaeota archaeon]|nr:hypothetical protein [Nanoarchaeota archaeon]